MDVLTYLFWGIILLLFIFKIFTRNRETLRDKVETNTLFDVNTLNDDVAKEVSFTPLVYGGHNFLTHIFKKESRDLARFKPTPLLYVFFSSFIVMGIVLPVIFLPQFLSNPTPIVQEEMVYIPVIITGGLFFIATGSFLLLRFGKPITFDLINGFYYKGWDFNRANKLLIKDIYSIQVLKEYCNKKYSFRRDSHENNPFFSYEINLVLKNKERVNVIDHGNKEKIREDAKKLSDFLGIPLWDTLV